MKKVLLVLAISISIGASAQLTVSSQSEVIGKYGNEMTPANRGQLTKFSGEYEWKFSNNSVGNRFGGEDIINFKGDVAMLDQLHQILKDCLDNQNDQNITLGSTNLRIKGIKFGGIIKSVKIEFPNGSTIMTEKHIDKLFNKK
jgi:hypothetical protein